MATPLRDTCLRQVERRWRARGEGGDHPARAANPKAAPPNPKEPAVQPTTAAILMQILSHTPMYVWAILAALVAFGTVQVGTREMSRGRVLALPIALAAYSLWGALTTFGAPALATVAWALGLALMLTLSRWLPWPRDARFDAGRGRFVVPGSVVPLLVMLAVFAVRYVATVELVLNPAWRGLPATALAGGLVYGVLAGVFALRARSILAGGVRRAAPAEVLPAAAAPAAQ